MSNNEQIRVIIRVRPLNEKEQNELGGKKCLNVDLQQNSIILDSKPEPKNFKFDFIGDADISQDQIFQIIAQPVAVSCLSGYNGTIFAYGQTGAGKTYTIYGPGLEHPKYDSQDYSKRGLLPRSLEFIFNSVHREMAKCTDVEYLIKCSFLEIYQEQVRDLLSTTPSGSLQLREDIRRGVYVEGLSEEQITETESAYELLRKGARNRHIGSTSMNLESSRSHAIFTLIIQSKERKDELLNVRFSRFHLVDLAGSERQKQTEACGERLKEAGMINKSLSALGNVINALVDIGEGKSRFIHYRDSKLTFFLKDSLGGNSKTCIVANISPANLCFNETLSTLKFAQRAKLIKTKAVVNEDVSGGLTMLKEEVARLRQELAKAKIQPCLKCNYNQLDKQEAQSSDYSLLILNDRLADMEELLHQEQNIRLSIENQHQEETKQLCDQQQNLLDTIMKYEQKITNDKMLIKIKEGQIQRFKQNSHFDNIQTQEYIKELKDEIEKLKENYEQHPVASKLFYDNYELKQMIEKLEQESEQKSSKLFRKHQELQEYNKKLNEMLNQSFQERKQLKCIIQEYQQWKLTQQGQTQTTPLKIKDPLSCTQTPNESQQRAQNRSGSPTKSLQFNDIITPLQNNHLLSPNKPLLISQSPVNKKFSELDMDQLDLQQSQILLLQQLQQITKEKEELQVEWNNLMNQNKKLKQESLSSQDMQDQIYQANEKFLEAEDKLRMAKEELETLQDSYNYLETQCQELREQNAQKTQEIQTNQQQVIQLQHNIKQKDSTIGNLMNNQEVKEQLDQK